MLIGGMIVNKVDDGKKQAKKIDWLIFGISGGAILLFVLSSLINIDAVSAFVNASFAWSVKWFGSLWQLLMFITFVVALVLAFSKYGSVRLVKTKPEFSNFKWVAMIMCALLSGGAVFWSAAEPMLHFLNTPPAYAGIKGGTEAAVAPALAISYLHWGYLAWGIFGTVSSIVLMHAAYEKGLPLKPRTLLYPVLGEKGVYGPLGKITDAFSILAVAAGTIGPIGFLALQMSFGLKELFGISDGYSTQVIIIMGVAVIHFLAAISSLEKGIQVLSNFNIKLSILLGACVLVLGPGGFVIDSLMNGFGLYTQDFVRISLFRGDNNWIGSWTLFYWGWFIGYGPLMAVFIARISKGRTIRELIIAVAIIVPIATNIWFTVLGGSGMFYELQNPGIISNALKATGEQAALFTIIRQIPLNSILAPVFLLLVVSFIATTGTGMTYTIAMVISGDETPSNFVRVFWAIMMDIVAAILLKIGGVSALQRWIVFSAVPVAIVLIPMIWAGPMTAMKMYKKQKLENDTSPSLKEDTLGSKV